MLYVQHADLCVFNRFKRLQHIRLILEVFQGKLPPCVYGNLCLPALCTLRIETFTLDESIDMDDPSTLAVASQLDLQCIPAT